MSEIFSQKWGRGPQKGQGAEPALLLHPALASSDSWRRVAGCLLDDLSMVAIDLPGHGRGGLWDGQADYHSACCAAAEPFLGEAVHLIGHSFGGTVALRLALRHPDKVRSLTLIEPVLFAAARGSAAYQQHVAEFQPFFDAMQAGDRARAAAFFIDMWGGGWAGLTAEQQGYMLQRIDLVAASAPALEEDNSAMLAEGRLESLGVPVLFLQGSQSPQIITAIGDALAARLPHFQRQQIAGAGHMAPLTHPEAVAGAIRAFVTQG